MADRDAADARRYQVDDKINAAVRVPVSASLGSAGQNVEADGRASAERTAPLGNKAEGETRVNTRSATNDQQARSEPASAAPSEPPAGFGGDLMPELQCCRDARRYRWWREGEMAMGTWDIIKHLGGEALDAAVDAAIADEDAFLAEQKKRPKNIDRGMLDRDQAMDDPRHGQARGLNAQRYKPARDES